jgi:hypothetical protein
MLTGCKKKNKNKNGQEGSIVRMRSKGRTKNRCRDEVFNDLKKYKVNNWTYLVKDRQAWHGLVQKTKTHKALCQQRQQNKT